MHVGEVQIPHFQLITLRFYRIVMIMDPAGAGIIFCGMIVVFFNLFENKLLKLTQCIIDSHNYSRVKNSIILNAAEVECCRHYTSAMIHLVVNTGTRQFQ